MITVQMTLEESLVKRVDEVAQKLNKSRSAFAREALKEALKRFQTESLEKKHKAGYLKKPVKKGEFDVFVNEQAWGEL